MHKQSMKKQTLLLTITNTIVRAMGFAMRIILSRVMGAQAIGIMELASSAHMLAITPVTAGIPLAVSRLTAKAEEKDRENVLFAGIALVKKAAWVIMPLFLLLSPFISSLLGDTRTFPTLLFSVPCVMILGLSAVYNGFCYGKSNATLPAMNELIEQVIRFSFGLLLLYTLPHLALSWYAAIPMLATTVAEMVGLIVIARFLHLPRVKPTHNKQIEKKLLHLALPTTLMRLCNTGLRSLNAILIPLQLRVSGLVAAEATARFGMLTGMVMPIMFLPSVATGALSMVASPKMASLESKPDKLKHMATQLMCFAILIGLVCAVSLYYLAPFISQSVYRLPELAPMIRFMCPYVVLMSLYQVLSGMIAGIGRQKYALYGTLFSAVVTVVTSFFLTKMPAYRIYGSAFAMMLGHFIGVIWMMGLLFQAISKAKRDDKCA